MPDEELARAIAIALLVAALVIGMCVVAIVIGAYP